MTLYRKTREVRSVERTSKPFASFSSNFQNEVEASLPKMAEEWITCSTVCDSDSITPCPNWLSKELTLLRAL